MEIGELLKNNHIENRWEQFERKLFDICNEISYGNFVNYAMC